MKAMMMQQVPPPGPEELAQFDALIDYRIDQAMRSD